MAHTVELIFPKRDKTTLKFISPPKHLFIPFPNEMPPLEEVTPMMELIEKKSRENSCRNCDDWIPVCKKKKICHHCDSFRKWSNNVMVQIQNSYSDKKKDIWREIFDRNMSRITVQKYKDIRERNKCESCKQVKNYKCFVGKKNAKERLTDENCIACCLSCLRNKYPVFTI